MEKHNFVTIADLSKEQILYLIQMAQAFEKYPNRELMKGKIVATLFFEPSTRTRLSFETAANRLGAKVIGFTDAKATSRERHNMPVKWLRYPLLMPVTVLICTHLSACSIYILFIKRRERSTI